MFCLGFFASWFRFRSSKSESTSPPLPTNTSEQGYQSTRPMDRPTAKIYDVIDAESQFGISYFIRYHSYSISPPGIVFYARPRKDPNVNMYHVLCPLEIDARNLPQKDQENLQLNLDIAKSYVPKKVWETLRVGPEQRRLVCL
ncbi:hypothetical protein BDV59DRAFT_189919 [Aspergillus ambiguus]|uniref:uncharacterized protein n=1 Tax=Aspergillus ambiguus TaxID=176160 RepID=UPI003CCCCE98